MDGICLLDVRITSGASTKPLYKQANAPVEERVKDLLGRMTLEEKVGQICCPLGWEMYTKTGKTA